MPGVPRRRQVLDAEAVYHVTFRAPAKRLLFRDGDDRDRYLTCFGGEARRRDWTIFSYCLMGTHGHLLARATGLDLGAGLKQVHERFAVDFNRRWDEHGTLFSNGPRYTLVRSERHLLATLRYVARNPVAAGLCEHPAQWQWSAHRALLGVDPAPDFLDTGATFRELGEGLRPTAYAYLTALDDRELLSDLRAGNPSTWLAHGVDEHRIPVDLVAADLGVSSRTVYARLAEHREALALSQKGRTLL